ncbi:hypothetical protein TKK_0003178 [Trichogramma kaykai]
MQSNFSDALRMVHFEGYNYGVKNKSKTRNKSLASSISYPTVKKTIQRAKTTRGKGKKIVKHYSSIQEFYKFLQQYPELLSYKDASISAHLISSASQSHHIMLYDSNFLAEFNNNNDMFADATFKISPDVRRVNQVLTVMCKKY